MATVLAIASGCNGTVDDPNGPGLQALPDGGTATGGRGDNPDGEPSGGGSGGRGSSVGGSSGRAGTSGGGAGRGTMSGGTTGGGDQEDGGAAGGGGTGGTAGEDAGDAGDGGTGGTGEPPVGDLIFVGDFETGDVSQYDGTSQCEPGRILVYSEVDMPTDAPTPRQGTFAARFRVFDTDVAPCTPNSTPRTNAFKIGLFMDGDEVWQSWSVYVPAWVADAPDGWLVIEEDYGPPFAGPPAVGWAMLFYDAPVFAMDTEGATQWSTPLVTDRWVDFLVHKRFSQSSATGFVEAWVDGEALTFGNCGGCTQLPVATMSAGQSLLDFILLQYRAAEVSGTADFVDLYFDDVRIGTTRDIVELD